MLSFLSAVGLIIGGMFILCLYCALIRSGQISEQERREGRE